MAENKKSFLLYSDLIHTIEKMSDEDSGKLFKHILKYVNDKNPTTDNIVIELVFEQIKQQLKRDLVKYESIRERNRINGKKGGRPKEQEEPKKPTGLSGNPKKPKKADNDNDNDNDNVSGNVSVSDSVNEKVKKKKEFSIPTPQEITDYGILRGYKLDGRKLFDYYNDNDWKDKNDVKVKNWKQKILAVWCKEENKIKQEPNILKLNEIDDNTHYWVKFKGVQKYKNIGFGIKKEATYNQLEYIETI